MRKRLDLVSLLKTSIRVKQSFQTKNWKAWLGATQGQATPAATSTKLEKASTILSYFVNKEKAYTLK